ncbi:MAG: flagellar hook-length control protein FliK [Haliea sp.]|uniref:flagellar hook-length control protein FliK n=1 Tax=Haliea sp. TaxID=1932666 RepID=UPI0032EBE01C
MEDIQLALTAARTDQKNFGLWLKNWQVGQTLSALVSGQRPSGELVLRVGGLQITATADIPVQQGARLLLEVRQLQPLAVLRIISPPGGTAAAEHGGNVRLLGAAVSGTETVNALARVVTLLQPAEGALRALPAESLVLVRQLLRSVATPAQLVQPAGLRAAVAASGTFSEAQLLHSAGKPPGTAPPPADMKSSLARVLAQVDARLEQVNAIPTRASDAAALLALRQELETALTAITANQLASLPADTAAVRSWAFTLPFLWQEEYRQLQLQLEREPREPGDEEDQERWRLQLNLDLPRLGHIAVEARLTQGQLAVEVVSDQPAVRRLVQASSRLLETALENRGLTLAGLVSRAPGAAAGSPPERSTSLDLRA